MICCKNSLILRQSYHFATNTDCVSLQLDDILKTLLNTEQPIVSWHLSLKRLNRWWKVVQSLICYSWIFNVQLHVHFKNWTLKFNLLYLVNHINTICRICCVNTCMQNLKIWLISVLSMLKYRKGLFLMMHPVQCIFSMPSVCPSNDHMFHNCLK